MKIIMKTSEEKGGSSNGQSSGNPKIRIAVIGQHEVGKSGKQYKQDSLIIHKPTIAQSKATSEWNFSRRSCSFSKNFAII